MKTCTMCRVEQPDDRFGKRNTACKKCSSLRTMQWQKDNPEKAAILRRAYNSGEAGKATQRRYEQSEKRIAGRKRRRLEQKAADDAELKVWERNG